MKRSACALGIVFRLILILLMSACGDMSSRQETADKLKPVLVLVNPPEGSQNPTSPLSASTYTPALAGQVVRLELHLIGPEQLGAFTIVSSVPEPRPLTLPIIAWTLGTPRITRYAGLSHVTVSATATLPSVEQLQSQLANFEASGEARLRYGFVVSDAERNLPLAGDFIVYRDAEQEQAARTLFGSSIDLPADISFKKDTTLDISSTIKNDQDEALKLGWYASTGEIKNRRARATEWKLPGAGRYTLVLTVRGKESRNGDIQIREITVP